MSHEGINLLKLPRPINCRYLVWQAPKKGRAGFVTVMAVYDATSVADAIRQAMESGRFFEGLPYYNKITATRLVVGEVLWV